MSSVARGEKLKMHTGLLTMRALARCLIINNTKRQRMKLDDRAKKVSNQNEMQEHMNPRPLADHQQDQETETREKK